MATENKRLNVNPILWSTADTTYVITEGEIWYYKRDSGIHFNLIGDGTSTASELEAAGLSEYTVVEQYTTGGQTVTKWSNGDMEIIGSILEPTVAIDGSSNGLFRTGGSEHLYEFIETFIGNLPIVSYAVLGVGCVSISDGPSNLTNLNPLFWSGASGTVAVDYSYTAKGKWK